MTAHDEHTNPSRYIGTGRSTVPPVAAAPSQRSGWRSPHAVWAYIIIVSAILIVLVLRQSAVWRADANPPVANAPTCIVLASSGNKLCGSDAAAWCHSTDAYRQSVSGFVNTYGTPAEQAAAANSAQGCADIEATDGN